MLAAIAIIHAPAAAQSGERPAMEKNYPELIGHLSKMMGEMRRGIPAPMRGFAELADTAKASGVLDHKTKELMAVAISIAIRCDGCIGFHTRAAVRAGATRQEFQEMIAVAMMMGGGPAAMYGADALNAFDQFASAAPPDPA
jgi:AhpD family alkylhydroperoxidase